MTDSARRKIFALLLLSAIAIAVLAAGLPRLQFQAGLPLPGLGGSGEAAAPEEEVLTGGSGSPLLKALAVFILVVLLVNAFVQLFKGVSWKEMATTSLQIGAAALLVALLLYLMLTRMPSAPPVMIPEIAVPVEEAAEAPLGAMPPLLYWLVAVLLAALVAVLGLWLAVSARRPPAPASRVGLEAEKARLALLAGQDLKSVILQCYRQMSRTLWQEQGIQRDACMTPREFEGELVGQGYPSGPVHELTRLFEAVRYGQWQPGPAAESDAIACLQAIEQHSRGQRREG